MNTTVYEHGHIPDAVGVNWTPELSHCIRHDIIDRPGWEALRRHAGVTLEIHLVFSSDNNWFAAYAYWIARISGHPRASLMNGGRKKWELEGRPLMTALPTISPTRYQAQEPDLRWRAFQREVLAYVGAPAEQVLADVRSPAEFSGEVIFPPGMTETPSGPGTSPGPRTFLGHRQSTRSGPSRAWSSCASSTPARGSPQSKTW